MTAGTGGRIGATLLRWRRSSFLINMLLIVGVLALALGLSALAFYHFVQRPRAEMLAGMFAAQLASVSAAVNELPPEARDAYLQRLDVLSEGSITIDDHTRWQFSDPEAHLAREFLEHVRRRLPDHRVNFSVEPTPQLWLEITGAGEHARWIRMPLSNYTTIPTTVWFGALLALVTLALGATAYLAGHSRRKLFWLGEAIDQIGIEPFPAAAPLALDQPAGVDLADLRHRFNEMSSRLTDANADRALMLAGVSHDMRTILTKLRLCLALDPATSALPGPIRYIEHMDRIIGQFLDFARPVEEEPAMEIDLNELVADVAADVVPDHGSVSLMLGAVPRCLLRPLAVRRLVMNLVENSMRHGGRAVQVATSMDGGFIVLRVLDRGPGVSAQELKDLTRPFFRTPSARGRSQGSGLGLAIAQRMVESHHGSLVLGLREGGGFQAEVRLPARFAPAEPANRPPPGSATFSR